MASRYSFVIAESSGDASTTRLASWKTIRACSFSAATEYTSAPFGPRMSEYKPIMEPRALFPDFLGIPTRLTRLRSPSSSQANKCSTSCFCHGRKSKGLPAFPATESFVIRPKASTKVATGSFSRPRCRASSGTGVSQRGGHPLISVGTALH